MQFKERFLLATSLLLLPCISTRTTEKSWTRRGKNTFVVWEAVDIPVSTRTEDISMDINIINPCDFLDPTYFLPGTNQSVKVECDRNYQLYIESLSQFCQKPNIPGPIGASNLWDSVGTMKIQFALANNIKADVVETSGTSMSAVSTVTAEIVQGIDINKRTAYEWRHGKLNPDFFIRLGVQLKCGDDCPFHLGKPILCSMNPDDRSFRMDITIPVINRNFAILRAQLYNVMSKENDNETCTSRYVGPSLVVVSGSKNCVIEVNSDDLVGKSVLSIFRETCKTALDVNNTDNVRQISCEPSQPNDHLKFVKRLNGPDYTYLYCPGSNYSVDGFESPCGDTLVKLSKTEDVTVEGILYPATTVNTNEQPLTPMMSFIANMILVPLKDVSKVQINDSKGTVKDTPLDHYYINLYGSNSMIWWICIGAVSVVAVIAVLWFCYRKCKCF